MLTVSLAPFRFCWLAAWLAIALGATHVIAGVGADMPWTTYEAEVTSGPGEILGPKYGPHLVETEASGQRCVKLSSESDYLEFRASEKATALVVRYSLPDSPSGEGTHASIRLIINGRLERTLSFTSRSSWLYGDYPFSNQPAKGKPRNFFDELRVKGLNIASGDVVRLQKIDATEPFCIVDFVDLENPPAPLAAPENALSVLQFGAKGNATADDTDALRACIAEARKSGKTVWVPSGDYKITGDIIVPTSVTIQGAGMWHTTFVGDESVYAQASRRVRFKLTGERIHLRDFSIVGKLNYRNDDEPNDGIVGAGCSDSSISRIWIEHTKVGVWVYNGVNLTIDGCRFRNVLADGVNLCVGTRGCVVENCSTRGTGDDCFAMWPAPSDQGFIGEVHPGNNVIRHCTGQLTFLANGGALYGGENNRIEDCLFTDISSGCGILISTTFPTSDDQRKIDNNFSGTTMVRNCELVRCGGYDHSWAWRGSLQLCLDRRSISGVKISDVRIRDSFSDGVTVVAPGSTKGNGTLSDTRIEGVTISNVGLGAPESFPWRIRADAVGEMILTRSSPEEVHNESEHFTVSPQ